MTSDADASFLTSSVLAPAPEDAGQVRRRLRSGAGESAGTHVRLRWLLSTALPVTAVLALATFLRFWQLDRIGFNSDEAVYSGTAASLAGNDTMRSMFPIFRAHPLFLQILLSFGMHGHISDWSARAVTAVVGVVTVAATYGLGRRLYGHVPGLIAALLLAVMPYHVIVSRQVLLDGLMTLFATFVLYSVVRYIESGALRWMLAACGLMGACVLSKETSIVLVGSLYAFFALTPAVRLRLRHLGLGLVVMMLVIIAFPLALTLSGRASSGQHYLLWQLFRQPNHETLFYAHVLPSALGWATIAVAVFGLVWLRRENTWRERLLVTWIAVPVVFFTLWPVKGYQYLLPLAPVAALLAGRTVARIGTIGWLRHPQRGRLAVGAVAIGLTVTLLLPTWSRINPSTSGSFLAGTGGVPGGREAGLWLKSNLPADAQLLAIGPSTANILEFYGQRRVSALSVSPDPANRNPAYVPVPNPNLAVRQRKFQYVVWDSYTANRSPYFGNKITTLVSRFHGVAVFTSTVAVKARSGAAVDTPVIVIYRVRPS
jgi:Dolichyl-phosphate-mannose-protein mannosyltransferase